MRRSKPPTPRRSRASGRSRATWWGASWRRLERIDGEPTRKALLDIIVKTRDFDLGGAKLTYGPDDNRGLDEVFLTVIQPDGTFKPVSTLARAGG